MSSRSLRVEDDAHDFFVKIILIGDSGVGKSNLISRFCDNKFTLQFNSTVGVEFTTKTLNMIDHGRPVMAQIWDTSGHTKARAITDAYYRGATGALLVYDVTRHITFVNTHKWLADLRNRAASDMVVMLVGNKSDVRQSVMVSTEAGKSFAEKESLCFMETSALRATNVEKAFVELVNEIYRNQINRKKDMEAHETMALSRSVSISSGNNEPAHYKLKIESFSLLSEAGIEKYESDVFEAGGYKWKLEVYPNGSEKELGNDHVSVYLLLICCHDMMMEKDWEVHVYFKILIYDHIRHNYLTIQGGDGQRTRFHEKKTRWGFRKLISLESFKDPENGYLFGDSCEFGAEVFVVPKYTQKDQCLSMMKPPVTMNTHVWTISNFTILKQQPLFSQDFKIGKVKWKLSLYPKGFKTGKNTNLSIFLRPHDVGSDEWKVYAKFKIQVKNQKDGGTHKSQEADHWFCKTAADGWGFPCFMLLSDLHDDKEGFLSNDTLIVEASIVIVGILKHLQ